MTTTTTLKALLAGSILATTASAFALAQDATVQAQADLALTPPASTPPEMKPDAEVQSEMNTETKTDIEIEDDLDAETNTIIQTNEDVMGALETGDDYALEKDVDSLPVEEDATDWQASDETQVDGDFDLDPDTELEIETDTDLNTPD